MNCPACGRDNPDAHIFCSFCGNRLQNICGQCGARNAVDARYCNQCGSSLDAIGGETPGPAAPPEPEGAAAERRHMTVMFCDIVGSTEMSGRMDPEDLRDLIRAFEADAGEVIEKHQGYIARYMGDGILVYYGFPQAREDDAERAVRCALDLVKNVGNDEVVLRVGIATGSVVARDVIGSGSAQEQSVVGQAPNLAARLQSLAPPHGVLIAPETRALVGDLFEYLDLGTQQLKGFEEPVTLWQVSGERRGVSRFESRHSADTGFYGREGELDLLIDRAEDAAEGKGQVLTLIAEPGMGKSRLALEFEKLIANQFRDVIRFNCSPHFRNTALYPVSTQIELQAKFGSDDTIEQKMTRLEAWLERSEVPHSLNYTVALMAMLFGDAYAATDNPDQQKEQILNALESRMMALSDHAPLMIVAEDLHWCDPTTMDLLQRMTAGIVNRAVLLLATGRPEFDPPWSDAEFASVLSLDRIREEACREIVAEMIEPGQNVSDHLLDEIIAKSDRVPLYVEELTRSVMESQQAIKVPDTLQDTLMERLDRMGEAKELAQLGAVIGRDFSHRLVTMISGLTAREVTDAIGKLVEADLLQVFGEGASLTYSFKHALLRDAAYESLLLRRRREVHGQIASVLEHRFGDVLLRQPELIAHHLTGAEQYENAIAMWQRAGLQATSQAAYTEAIDHFRNALALVPELEAPQERAATEIELQGLLGNALSRSFGYAAPEVETAFERELDLAAQLGEQEQCAALRRIGTFYIVRADFPQASRVTDQCIEIADANSDVRFQIDGYNALGHIQAYTGELGPGRRSLEHALNLYRENNGHTLTYVTEQDPAMSALALLCVVAWLMGDSDAGKNYKQELLETARLTGRPFDNAYANTWAAIFETLYGNQHGAIEHADFAIALSKKHSLALWERFAGVLKAAAQQELGTLPAAPSVIRENLLAYRMTGAVLIEPLLWGLLAKSCLVDADVAEALEAIDEALESASTHGERFLYPWLLALKAEICEAQGDRDTARSSLIEALAEAQAQEAVWVATSIQERLA